MPTPTSLPDDEAERLRALTRYQVLDTPPEQGLDDLAFLASQICETPMAFISFIDSDRQWFKSTVGITIQETSRDCAFCAHCILESDLMIVPDALTDGRFVNSPLLTHDPKIRFFAGAPLYTPNGHNLGTLCVMDRVPRHLSENQKKALRALGRQVMSQLEHRCEIQYADKLTEKLKETLEEREGHIRLLMDSTAEGIVGLDLHGRCTFCNRACLELLRFKDSHDLIGKYMHALIHHTRQDGSVCPVEECQMYESFQKGIGIHLDHEIIWRRDGTSFSAEYWSYPVWREGRIVGAVVAFVDISDRKGIEDALKKMNIALTHATPGISLLSKDGHYLHVNEAYASLLGHLPEELLGHSWKRTVHPDDHASAMMACETMWTSGKAEFEARAVRKDGSIFYKQVVMVKGTENVGDQESYHCFMRDITERKQAEELIIQSRDFSLTLLEKFPAMIWKSGFDAKCDYFNQTWLDFTGRTLEEEYGDGWTVGVHPDDVDRCLMTYNDAFEARERFEMEYRLRRHDGEYRWILSVGHPFNDLDGNFSGYIGSCYCITQRKNAEEALAVSEHTIRELYDITSNQHRSFEERIRSLLELGCRRFALPHGMLTCLVDDQLELSYLQSPNEEFVENMLVPQCQAFCGEALNSEVPLSNEHIGQSEWRHHPGYEALGLEAYLGTRVVVSGIVYGTLCFANTSPYHREFSEADRNVLQLMARWIGGELERKQAEETLQESEERYRALYDDNPSMYFTVRSDGTVLSVNQYGAKELGFSKEELVGQSVLRVFHEDDKLSAQQRIKDCLLNPGTTQNWEFRKVRKDGTVFWVKEVARTIQDRVGHLVVLIVCEEITEQKIAEEELKLAYEQLRELTRALNETEEKERMQFARELHDEFGQCLTALKLDLGWVSRRLGTVPSFQSLSSIQGKIRDMSGLVDQTGHAVRRMASSMRPRMLDDLGLLAALEWQVQECQARSGIVCEMVVDSTVSELEFSDAQAITIFRISQELSTNVIRHAQATTLRFHLSEDEGSFVLEVQDNGIGISQSSIDRPKSFGILGIRERVSLLGGECLIVGTPEKGTMVKVRIPLIPTLHKVQ